MSSGYLLMIIVHVHRTYWPVLGGAERAIQRICEELVKFNHEVHIVTSIYGARNRPRYEEVNGVHIHRVKAWTLYFPDLTVPREVPRELLRKADIIHGWSQNSYFTYRICKEAKKLGKPVVMYFLGVDYLQRHYNPLIRLFGYLYQKWITWNVVKITDLALVTNEYERKLLKERYGINAIVLPHGVDELYLKLPNMAEYFRRKYGIDGKIIAYIGRIHPTKGLDLLISVFAKVAKQVPDAVLVIAGKGDERYLKRCLRLAEKLNVGNKIKYIGYISEKDKIALIDASNIIVMPTRHVGESYPLLIDEVLARNKRIVVVTTSPSLKNKDSRYIINTNITLLEKILVNILTNLSNSQRHEIASERSIKSWNEVVKNLLNVYEQCYNVQQ